MAKILMSPSKYIQGSGELQNISKYVKNYGNTFGSCIRFGNEKDKIHS